MLRFTHRFPSRIVRGSKYLLAWADQLEELKTICYCGRKANFVLRLNDKGEVVRDGAQIQIGGNDSYLSVCRLHYKEKIALLSVLTLKSAVIFNEVLSEKRRKITPPFGALINASSQILLTLLGELPRYYRNLL